MSKKGRTRNVSALIIGAICISFAFAISINLALADPVLVLDPSQGDPFTLNGAINGNAWICASGEAPVGEATVSGMGVSGSAFINRDGSLSGSFTIRGDAGQSMIMTVTASTSCTSTRTPTNLQATAIFTFNMPTPTPTATAAINPIPSMTSIPIRTPIVTPTPIRTLMVTLAPKLTPVVAPKPFLTTAPAMITFIGCSPSTGKVQAKFDPVNAKPGTPSFTVPAVQAAGQPGTFSMDLSQAKAGTVYKVQTLTEDPGCGISSGEPQAYWLPGNWLNISFVIAGKTELWTNSFGFVKGGDYIINWTKEATFEGYNKAKSIPFKLTTELKADKTVLQASYFPMPSDLSSDPMSPPSLLATWDIPPCTGNCVFTIDISDLLPSQNTAKKSWANMGLDSIKSFFTGIGDGAKITLQSVSNMLGAGQKSKEMTKMTEVKLSPPVTTSVGNYMKEKGNVVLPTTFYFRTVLLDKNGKPAGNPSKSVKIIWSAQVTSSGPDFKIETTPQKPQKPYANWSVEFLSYHGILKPKKSESCFIVTEKSTGQWVDHDNSPGDPSHVDPLKDGSNPSTLLNHQYFKGDIICQPDPPEGCGWSDLGACVGDLISYFEDAVNWVSEAYESAKNKAAGFVADGLGVIAIPGCDKSCLKDGLSIGMDVALTSMGVPPSIPNFDELEEQGLDYLAEQTIEAAAPELPTGALEMAGVDPKEEIKNGIKKGLAETQKSYANSVGWLPKGVPVRPDGPQLPIVTLKVTRSKSDSPDYCDGGSLYIQSFATMPANAKAYHPSYWPKDIETHDIKPSGIYKVFEPRSISLPCSTPGTNMTIPVVLNPLYLHIPNQAFPHDTDTAYFWWLYSYTTGGELRVKTSSGDEVKFNIVPNDPKWW